MKRERTSIDKYLIDTSVWIPALRRGGPPRVRARMDNLIANNQVAINGIIKAELLQGAKDEREFERTLRNLDSLEFLDSADWNRVGELGFQLRRKGTPVPLADLVIAVDAELSGTILLHADSHFELISRVSHLKAENMLLALKRWKREAL